MYSRLTVPGESTGKPPTNAPSGHADDWQSAGKLKSLHPKFR